MDLMFDAVFKTLGIKPRTNWKIQWCQYPHLSLCRQSS